MVIKETLKFIHWYIKNFGHFAFLWLLGVVLIAAGVLSYSAFVSLGIVILFSLIISTRIFQFRKQYKAERNELFSVIKKSS